MNGSIFVDYSVLKSFFTDSNRVDIVPQFIEFTERYLIRASDNNFQLESEVRKTTPRNSDQVDWEDNFKSDSNRDPLIKVADNKEYEDLKIELNSQQTIRGRRAKLGAAKTEAVYQMWLETKNGNEKQEHFAQAGGIPDKRFMHKWSDALTLFPTVPLNNAASLLFDGSDEYIDFGDNYSFGPSISFTWSIWLKPQNIADTRTFISKTSLDANIYGYNFGHFDSGKLYAQLRAPGSLTSHTYETVLIAGDWYHVCYTYAGGANINGMTCYINGVAEPLPESADVNAWAVTDSLRFGTIGELFFFSGNLNQATVWNKELSEAEVVELYNLGVPSKPETHSATLNLLSHWPMNSAVLFPTETDKKSTVHGTLKSMEAEDYIEGDIP